MLYCCQTAVISMLCCKLQRSQGCAANGREILTLCCKLQRDLNAVLLPNWRDLNAVLLPNCRDLNAVLLPNCRDLNSVLQTAQRDLNAVLPNCREISTLNCKLQRDLNAVLLLNCRNIKAVMQTRRSQRFRYRDIYVNNGVRVRSQSCTSAHEFKDHQDFQNITHTISARPIYVQVRQEILKLALKLWQYSRNYGKVLAFELLETKNGLLMSDKTSRQKRIVWWSYRVPGYYLSSKAGITVEYCILADPQFQGIPRITIIVNIGSWYWTFFFKNHEMKERQKERASKLIKER